MEEWKRIKNILLGCSCINCLYKREDINLIYTWCLKHPHLGESFDVDENIGCNDWITDKIDLSNFPGLKIITLNDLKLLEEYIKEHI